MHDMAFCTAIWVWHNSAVCMTHDMNGGLQEAVWLAERVEVYR